ncbi:MAG: cytochrome ubiquinol oxidase subunit I [Deltaproteobacteria bacterium]|nr:cytochrome ubiquinol oxidase subunit I [Deltaproteobacteria bacterium]
METWSNPLLLSRFLFALTTMFHIGWAILSVGLSLFLVVLEVLWLKTGDDDYYRHARFWGKLFLLNFAVGVASGVPLEFHFGANWARFSAATGGFFGNILGFETILAFMLEAGFMGVMLFGWGRISRRMHLFATCMVALGASLSAFWIMVANSWMQTPAGGFWQDGRFITTSFWQALFNPDMPWGVNHMWFAALETTLFVIGGLSAWFILKERHVSCFTKSFKVALAAAIVIAPAQIYLGDGSGRSIAHHQPAKLGAIEALWETNPPGEGAPVKLFAWPNQAEQKNDWELGVIPHGLSLLMTHTLNGTVKGLKEFPPEDQPPVPLTFFSFRIMAGIGFLMFFLMLWTVWVWRRGGLEPAAIGRQKWLLYAWIATAPLGYVAVETGWLVREVGRQPWIIYGLMRTSEGVSPLPANAVLTSFFVYFSLYTLLSLAFLAYAARIINKGPDFDSPVLRGSEP